MKNNYYDILGVTPDSETDEIKNSYRKLARRYHPDVNPQAINKFKEINEAYSTLSDYKKRMQYDMLFGFYRKAKPDEKETLNSEQTKSAENTKKRGNNENCSTTEENHENSNLRHNQRKFFDDLFNSKTENQQPQKGSDITVEVTVSIPESINGTTKTVNVLNTTVCPRCKGRKFINGGYCRDCGGKGEITEQRRLNVKIPKGIKNLSKLRLTGEGNKGVNGGANGDLYLIVKIEGNSNIKFSGKSILFDVPIQSYEAVLGTSLSLNTPYGRILIKIPAKTKSGQKFRVLQNINGKENEIIVTVHVEIPSYLSDDEIKLYEKLKKISSCDIRKNYSDV